MLFKIVDVHRWRHLHMPLGDRFCLPFAIFTKSMYLNGQNISIGLQLRCMLLLEDIVHFYLDFTVYDMPNSLFSSRHPFPWDN